MEGEGNKLEKIRCSRMSYPNQDGPTKGTRPAMHYTTCYGCKHHSHKLVKSGHDPLYKDECTHETAPRTGLVLITMGNLKKDIENNIEPGDWCPFLENNLQNQIDTLNTKL
jgi:hypothetical protein